MPHQCVRCNTFYDDGANEILNGCKCGGRLFFYVRKEKIAEAEKIANEINLTIEDKEQIERDVFELVGSEIDTEKPVVLDLESIRVLKPGQYELDLVHLFKGDPLVVRLGEGKYMIDIAESFRKMRKKE